MMAMKGKAPTPKQFQLFENEELVECPYNMAHQVTNAKMMNHLMKCRRNYQKLMENDDGSMMAMLACKYNWLHQVPAPELLYHERTCTDRYNIVPHIIEMSRAEREKAGIGQAKKYEIYLTTGVESKRGETSDDKQRGSSSKPGNHATVTNNSSTSRSVSNARSYYEKESSNEQKGHASIKVDPLKKYNEELQRTAFKVAPEDDWDIDCAKRGFNTYDPSRKLETDLILKYPTNLTKSERKAWKIENMEKARRMFGEAIAEQGEVEGVFDETVGLFHEDDEELDIDTISTITNRSSISRMSSITSVSYEYTTTSDDTSAETDLGTVSASIRSTSASSSFGPAGPDRYKDQLEKSLRTGREGLARKRDFGNTPSTGRPRNPYFDDEDDEYEDGSTTDQ